MTEEQEPVPGRQSRPAAAKGDSAAPRPRVVAFEDLADQNREVVIEYRGQQYRLRTTRHGGLILNK